jgi:hypothetical protein
MGNAAIAVAGFALLIWILGKSIAQHRLALTTGGAFSLILVFLADWIIYRSVAARVRAEDAFRESEERFRLFVEGVHEYAII